MSGVGKSFFLEQLSRELFDLNPGQAFAVLNFNFEMPSDVIQLRNISGKLHIPTRQLLSAENTSLNDEALKGAEDYVENDLSQYPVYYAEHPRTVAEYIQICKAFYDIMQVPILILSDHSGLFKTTSDDKGTVEFQENLAKAMMALKKSIPCTQVILSQLNRDIERAERRIPKHALNYVGKSDLRNSDALFNASDFVGVLHCPFRLNFPPNSYGPLKLSTNQEDIYLHVVKQRDGQEAIIQLTADFKNMRLIDRI